MPGKRSTRATHALLAALAASALALPAALIPTAARGEAQAGQAQGEPETESAVRTDAEIDVVHARLLGELMSPYCQGLTLADCPSSGAAAMRDDIRNWLHEGRTERWIVDTLVAEWGDAILAAPRFRGLGVIAWLAPFVALAAAFAGLLAWLRRQSRSPAQAPLATLVAPAGVPDEALRDRVEAEVRGLLP